MERKIIGVPIVLALCVVCARSNRAQAQCEPEWLAGAGLAEINGGVRAMTIWDPDGAGPDPEVLVVGGGFSTAGEVTANYIACWDGSSWSALGNGLNGSVYTLAVQPDGGLVAGGLFTAAAEDSGYPVARWDGVSWSALGSGLSGRVRTLAVLPNGDLVAGGRWLTDETGDLVGIVRWDGDSWSALTGGIDSFVEPVVSALAVMPNGDLIAGGDFTTIGEVHFRSIARWDGTAWSALGRGMSSGTVPAQVHTLMVLPNGNLIAGGKFFSAGGQTCYGIARWDGVAWSALGSGMDTDVFHHNPVANVYALTVLPNGDVVAGGDFTTAGDAICNGIARWDGSSWYPLGGGIDDAYEYVYSLTVLPNGDLIAGGDFTSVDGKASAHLARWGDPCADGQSEPPDTLNHLFCELCGLGSLNATALTLLTLGGMKFGYRQSTRRMNSH